MYFRVFWVICPPGSVDTEYTVSQAFNHVKMEWVAGLGSTQKRRVRSTSSPQEPHLTPATQMYDVWKAGPEVYQTLFF